MHAGAQVGDRELDRRHHPRAAGAAGRHRGRRQGRGRTIVTRTLRDLQEKTHSAVETSKQTAAAAVSEMLETHGMLRSDTTALFERLREANILLQEVLSGAHDNMSEIESTLVTRVADFVTAMNEVAQKTGTTNPQVEQHITSFQQVERADARPTSASSRPSSTAHGRSLAEAVVADRPQQPAHRGRAQRAA